MTSTGKLQTGDTIRKTNGSQAVVVERIGSGKEYKVKCRITKVGRNSSSRIGYVFLMNWPGCRSPKWKVVVAN